MIPHGLCVESLATGRTVCAQIGTKEHVMSVVRHGGKLLRLVRLILTDSASHGNNAALSADKIRDPPERQQDPL
jgi:hypothetical protein